MTGFARYDDFNREELIELLSLKNKKIDSQRSMLYQLRLRRDKLDVKLKEGTKIKRGNATLKARIDQLEKRIVWLLQSGVAKARTTKEFAPILANALMAFYKLKKDGLTDNLMVFLILGHQKGGFFLSDVEKFNKKWGRNPNARWRNELRAYCETGLFHSDKMGKRKYYFLTLMGRVKIECIFKYIYGNWNDRSGQSE